LIDAAEERTDGLGYALQVVRCEGLLVLEDRGDGGFECGERGDCCAVGFDGTDCGEEGGVGGEVFEVGD
tara:strand:- start:994 stop:1200 length:207 start_codon:yes stop_codon:yes gene_type:complete